MSQPFLNRLSMIAAVAALGLGLGAGCALTQKSDPVNLRYFTPEASEDLVEARGAEHGQGLGRGLEVQLGRVNSASSIKDRIAYRDQSHEVGYYDDLRWSEKPEAYLRRAIGRALFEDQGMRELIGKPGYTVEVELDSFEELRAPRHVARVELTWTLRDEQTVHTQRTFAVERPIRAASADKTPDAITAAMAAALGEAVRVIASGVVTEMAPSRASATIR